MHFGQVTVYIMLMPTISMSTVCLTLNLVKSGFSEFWKNTLFSCQGLNIKTK